MHVLNDLFSLTWTSPGSLTSIVFNSVGSLEYTHVCFYLCFIVYFFLWLNWFGCQWVFQLLWSVLKVPEVYCFSKTTLSLLLIDFHWLMNGIKYMYRVLSYNLHIFLHFPLLASFLLMALSVKKSSLEMLGNIYCHGVEWQLLEIVVVHELLWRLVSNCIWQKEGSIVWEYEVGQLNWILFQYQRGPFRIMIILCSWRSISHHNHPIVVYYRWNLLPKDGNDRKMISSA